MLMQGCVAKCDNCDAQTKFHQADTLEIERWLRKSKWAVVRLDFYGNMGHYCTDPDCQAVAKKQRWKPDE